MFSRASALMALARAVLPWAKTAMGSGRSFHTFLTAAPTQTIGSNRMNSPGMPLALVRQARSSVLSLSNGTSALLGMPITRISTRG